ncbi:MAG: sigma-70 family RNA polymerase sigma factor [Verrucomicrobiota bacterium]
MKMTTSDSELLQQFARDRSEKVFATLVSRHVDLVYSAALRQVRSPQLAEDVAQTVFIDLSRNADKLTPDTILTAWLYRVTRRAAIDVVRSESRRQLREQIAVELADMNSPDTNWNSIEPLLDEAMDTLDEADRSSILLRYFENKSLREVGQTLGTSDDAAQKRVSRAVERLREFFSKRGVTVGASGLAVVISANAVQAAPIGFALTISSALAGTTLASATTATAIKTIAMTTLQKSLITAIVVATVGAGIYEAREASTLRTRVQSLEQQQQSAPANLQQSTRELDEAKRQLAELRAENERLNRNATELIKLRGEVARLRSSEVNANPAQAEMKSWLARVDQLKKRLEENPDQKIPELQFVTEQDWLDATHGKFKSDKDIREALSRLRRSGESVFAGKLDSALRKYLEANNGRFPGEVSELQKYFKPPIEVAFLERYEVVPPKISPDGKIRVGNQGKITQRFPIDREFDARFTINPEGISSSYPAWRERTGGDSDWEILSPATKAYKAAYGISNPTDLSLLRPFVTTPEQKAALEKVIQAEKDSDKK